MPREPLVEGIDVLICIAVTADFISRLTICLRQAREFLLPTNWADLAAIASFFARIVGKGAGFLRTYKVFDHLRSGFSFLRRNEEVIVAAVNLAVFAFVMMGIVFATQYGRNRAIGNYVDALSFTVTSLTTAGNGDDTLHGTGGPLISVVVMICGVTLFLVVEI